MKIPKRFQLLGVTYTVDIVLPQDWKHEDDCVGIFFPHRRHIDLKLTADDALEHSFMHELTHAVLHAMGKDRLYHDEAFVDLVAGLFHQALTSNDTRK